MSVPLPGLAVAIVAAFVGALFVSADAALSGLSSARMAALLEQDGRPFKSALERYQRSPWRMRSTYIVGRTVCAATTAVMLAEVMAALVPGRLGLVAAVLMSGVLFGFSDLATSIAHRSADDWGLRLATYLRPFELLLWPLAAPLAMASEALVGRIQEEKAPDPDVASAEVEHFVDEVERSGVVGAEPAEIIRNVLEFEDRRVRDVMVPRSRVEGIDLATPLDKVRLLVAESGHSRYPIFDGQLDNVVGLLVAKDVFKLESGTIEDTGPDSSPRALTDVVRRDVIFVHEQQKLATLLRDMRHKRQHLAVVVDEFGGTSGIVTLEDVIEEIVGDIRDEHDEVETAPIQEAGEGRLIAQGSMLLEDLCAYLGVVPPEEGRAETLSSLFESPVAIGDRVQRWNLELAAKEVEDGSVQRVEVRRPMHSLPPSSGDKRAVSDTAPKPGSAEAEPSSREASG